MQNRSQKSPPQLQKTQKQQSRKKKTEAVRSIEEKVPFPFSRRVEFVQGSRVWKCTPQAGEKQPEKRFSGNFSFFFGFRGVDFWDILGYNEKEKAEKVIRKEIADEENMFASDVVCRGRFSKRRNETAGQ